MISIPCACGKAVEFDDDLAGTSQACPFCHQSLQLPGTAPAGGTEGMPPPPVPDTEDLTDLAVLEGPEANALVAALNLEGIRAMLWEKDATYFGGAAGATVKVSKDDLEKARALYAEWEKDRPKPADTVEKGGVFRTTAFIIVVFVLTLLASWLILILVGLIPRN